MSILLLESATDHLLLETSDSIELEATVFTAEAILHTEDIQLAAQGGTITPGARWFAIAEFRLDRATQYESSVKIQHPSRTYTGKVLSWGSIEMSIAMPAGMPQISGGQIRVADTDGALKDFLVAQTPRRRQIILKLVQENASEASFPALYKGEFEDFEKGPGYVQLSFKDITYAWLDDQISGLINRTNFPELDPGVDEAFLPIILGSVLSPAGNLQGAIPLPHIGYTVLHGDRWGLAQHPISSVPAVYRKTPTDGVYVLVNPSEYAITVEARTIEGVNYNLSFLDFAVQQTPLPLIAIDCHGVASRGGWNGFAAVTGSPLRNAIDHFINMSFLVFTKAGVTTNFAAGHIMVLRERFETLALYSDGALVKAISVREFFGQFLGSSGLQMFQNKDGQLDLAFIEAEDTGRPVFSQNRYMERMTYREFRASPTVNKARYNFAQSYVTGEFAQKKVLDNSADATALGKVEDDTINLPYVRDSATALYIITQRMRYQALGSYRQEFTLPAPEVMSLIELAKQIGITHTDGMDVGGYINKEVVITSIMVDLDKFRARVKSILRIPKVIDQSVTWTAEAAIDDGSITLLGGGSTKDFVVDAFGRGPTIDAGDAAWTINVGLSSTDWILVTNSTAFGHGFINASNQIQMQNSIFAASYGGYRHSRSFASPYYVQARYKGWLAGTNGRTGLFLNCDGDVNNGITWVGITIIAGSCNNWGLMQGGAGNNALLACAALSVGDLLRMEVRGDGKVYLLQNGVEVQNITPASIKSPSYAGFWQANTSGGTTSTMAWDDFEFGDL
jgi:hypothetical protein